MTTCTFDENPGRRPVENDFDGFTKEDDAQFPPNIVTDPTAKAWNQMAILIQRIASMEPAASLSVHTTGSTAAPFAVVQCKSLRSDVTISTFTTATCGTGDVLIGWPAGTFPSAVLDPEAILTGDTSGVAIAQGLTNSVRVRVFNLSGAAVLPFNLHIWG